MSCNLALKTSITLVNNVTSLVPILISQFVLHIVFFLDDIRRHTFKIGSDFQHFFNIINLKTTENVILQFNLIVNETDLGK
jgi:hypothetical protein